MHIVIVFSLFNIDTFKSTTRRFIIFYLLYKRVKGNINIFLIIIQYFRISDIYLYKEFLKISFQNVR